MKDLCIREVNTDDDLKRAFEIRKAVFVQEQNISMHAEFDGLDNACRHLMALIGTRVVGTLRIRAINERFVKIERVAVLKRERGRQIGAELMKAALNFVANDEPHFVQIHAQVQAKSFYARLGFVASGDIFDEDGIPHIVMHIDVS